MNEQVPSYSRGWVFAIAVTLAVTCVVFVVGRLPGLPYNVRELFGSNPAVASFGLAASFVLLAVQPWWIAELWSRNSAVAFACSIGTTFLITTVTYFTISSVAPVESIDDLVGTPVLEIGQTTERWFRFMGLLLGVLWAQATGIFIARQRAETLNRHYRILLGATMGLVVSYIVVVVFACTDNVTELLAGGGLDIFVVGLPLWFVALGWTVARSTSGFNEKPYSLNQLSTVPAILIGGLLAGWFLVNLATESNVQKYGETFSALQFLLSPSRSDYLPVSQLVVRFSILHFAILAEMLLGWVVYRAFGAKQSSESLALESQA